MESCGGGVGWEARKRGRVKDAADGDKCVGGGDEPDSKRGRMSPWGPHPHPHPASRIYRVSRASGGKDRHSKVYTAKGIRDRRVRLSVGTAIQFYDLQDRLGYDQPSKAIEWLIKAAADAIDKLPSLHDKFPSQTPGFPSSNPDGAAVVVEEDDARGNQQQRSGCSSTSETSKGSVLSLSRSESRRVKARERARERSAAAAAKDKDPGADDAATRRAPPTTSSFTELLTGMASAAPAHKPQPPATASAWTTANYIGFAQQQQPPARTAFASPAPHLVNIAQAQHHHFGFSAAAAAGAVTVASGGAGEPPHAEMTQHFSFLQDHFMPTVQAAAPAPAPAGPAAGDYNLNFSMSSGLVGVNSRGTLQSNSHIAAAHHHQLQRLSSATPPLDAPNIPFLFSPAAAAAVTAADTQFAAAFQLWNGFHHAADMKEKGKN